MPFQKYLILFGFKSLEPHVNRVYGAVPNLPKITAAGKLALTQLCIVHQIRNSCKFVPWSERREFAADLREVYSVANEKAASEALDRFDRKWGAKYAYASRAGARTGRNWSSFWSSRWKSGTSSTPPTSSRA